ncbi:MAG: DUF4390 domain-containing protein [Rubrivivax sp.]|jgi:hypothetical protein|nr:DUF4390 domain-containing protein [Rubrivivax sp.]
MSALLRVCRIQRIHRVRHALQRGLCALVAWVLALSALTAQAQGVELLTLQATRAEGAVNLEFSARVALPRAVDDALQKGVPLYFVAEATLLRNRWYWRDERVARLSRSWRLAFQPLTGAWRVSLGGLHQTYASLDEALGAVSRSGGWKLIDADRLERDGSYYVEFSYRLDSSQLPGPMQFGLGGGADWAVGVSRTLRIDP